MVLIVFSIKNYVFTEFGSIFLRISFQNNINYIFKSELERFHFDWSCICSFGLACLMNVQTNIHALNLIQLHFKIVIPVKILISEILSGLSLKSLAEKEKRNYYCRNSSRDCLLYKSVRRHLNIPFNKKLHSKLFSQFNNSHGLKSSLFKSL